MIRTLPVAIGLFALWPVSAAAQSPGVWRTFEAFCLLPDGDNARTIRTAEADGFVRTEPLGRQPAAADAQKGRAAALVAPTDTALAAFFKPTSTGPMALFIETGDLPSTPGGTNITMSACTLSGPDAPAEDIRAFRDWTGLTPVVMTALSAVWVFDGRDAVDLEQSPQQLLSVRKSYRMARIDLDPSGRVTMKLVIYRRAP